MSATDRDSDDWVFFPSITEARDPNDWSERERKTRYLQREHTIAKLEFYATVPTDYSVRWYDQRRPPNDDQPPDIEADHGAVVELGGWI